MNRRVKWWMILVPVLAVVLALVLTVIMMWDGIYIRLAPTAVLAEAMTNTFSALSARSEGTPWKAMSKVMAENEKCTTDVDISLNYGSDMRFDIDLQALNDPMNTQFQMDMNANASLYGYINLDINMGIYSDRECMAFNWAELFGSDYYGISFDTFGEDVRSNQLVYDAVGEEALVSLEEAITVYKDQLSGLQDYSDGFAFPEEWGTILKDFVLERKPAVEKQEIELKGQQVMCYNVAYTLTDAEMADLAEQLFTAMEADESFREYYQNTIALYEDVENGDAAAGEEAWNELAEEIRDMIEDIRESDGTGTVSFAIYEDVVAGVEYSYASEDAEVTVSLLLGANAAEDDIVLAYDVDTEDNTGSLEVVLTMEKGESTVEETLSVVLEDNYEDLDFFLSYGWDRENGDLAVSIQSEDTYNMVDVAVDLKLYEEETGIRLEVADIFAILAELDSEAAAYYEGCACALEIAVHSGAEITKPEYINIRELDQERISEMEENIKNHFGFGF